MKIAVASANDRLARARQRAQDLSSPCEQVHRMAYKHPVGELALAISATSTQLWRTLDWARVAGFAAPILVSFAVVIALTIPAPPVFSPRAGTPEKDDYLHWVEGPPLPPPLRMIVQ